MKLKILSTYTGKNYLNIQQILIDKFALDLLWLEILFNDKIQWERFLNFAKVRRNYLKACAWQKNFRSLLESCGIKRKKLKERDGKIDNRDYRKFIEALHYVS